MQGKLFHSFCVIKEDMVYYIDSLCEEMGVCQMLVLHKKKHRIDFYTVWFAKEPLKKSGIIAYREYMGEQPLNGKECHTLLTDLTETEEEIKQHFSKSCKYKVNRAAREDVSIEIIKDNEITDAIIDSFADFFAEFWESKGSSLEDKQKLKQELRAYRDVNALSIGWACVNGVKAVYHTHVKDESIARLLHSASLYRLQGDEEGNTKNLIGMANRLLHFEEMKYFKAGGLETYDWGGAGRGEDVIHITEFKESFGGTAVTYCNFEQSNGILAKLFKLLTKLL